MIESRIIDCRSKLGRTPALEKARKGGIQAGPREDTEWCAMAYTILPATTAGLVIPATSRDRRYDALTEDHSKTKKTCSTDSEAGIQNQLADLVGNPQVSGTSRNSPIQGCQLVSERG